MVIISVKNQSNKYLKIEEMQRRTCFVLEIEIGSCELHASVMTAATDGWTLFEVTRCALLEEYFSSLALFLS
jgi:hypothetical protein